MERCIGMFFSFILKYVVWRRAYLYVINKVLVEAQGLFYFTSMNQKNRYAVFLQWHHFISVSLYEKQSKTKTKAVLFPQQTAK